MNKREIAKRVSEKMGMPENKAKKVVNTIFEVITDGLATRKKVRIKGFGTFLVKERKPRRIRNPRTGEIQIIEAHRAAVFRPSNHLKKVIAKWTGY